MLNRLELHCPTSPDRLREEAAQRLAPLYPWLAIQVPEPRGDPEIGRAPEGEVVWIETARWRHPDFDPLALDAEIALALAVQGSVSLAVADLVSTEVCLGVARQVLTRYHRLIEGRNRASAQPLFDRARGLFRALHDLSKPLVAADHDHALDTWRWTLRLEPEASLEAQLAALFHDIERLQSEGEVRVEPHREDYVAFKLTHADTGAEMVRRLLTEVGADAALADRVAGLVQGHAQPGRDPDRELLDEANALSFFSLDACGFAACYGREHTLRKVRHTLERLGPRGQEQLGQIRHRADIAALIAEARR